MKRTLCVGQMVCDIPIGPVMPDMLSHDTNIMDFIRVGSGGDAMNVAVKLVGLGFESLLIGRVGTDEFADIVRSRARSFNIDDRYVIVDTQHQTSASVVMIHADGERSFAYHGGATDALSESDVPDEALAGVAAMHIGSACALPGLDGEGLAKLLPRARAHGVTTFADITGIKSADEINKIKLWLPYADWFVPSLIEAKMLTGKDSLDDMFDALHAFGAENTGIKLGGDGVALSSGGRRIRVPAYDVPVRDSTGAGDSFVSGFIAGTVLDWSLERRAALGCAMGALCVRDVGATAGRVNLDEAVDFMENHKKRD